MLFMNEQVEKTDELIALEDEIINLIGAETPDEEKIYELLDDIYILGYEQAVKDTGEDSSADPAESAQE
jgi:hypothetical protein